MAVVFLAVLGLSVLLFYIYTRPIITTGNCEFGNMAGDKISIKQGTVAMAGTMSIGIVNIEGGTARMSLWKDDDSKTERKVNLGPCENATFNGYMIYVLSVAEWRRLPFQKTGSGTGSVDIFIVKVQ